MRVHIGSDHAGFELKAQVVSWLAQHGHDPIDHGAAHYDAEDDYPVFCLPVAAAVAADRQAGIEALGIVIGGSGNGEQISANKVTGIRAALVWSDVTAQLARQHNDANVAAIGARMHSPTDAIRFIEIFLETPFSGGARHVRRIGELARYERTRELPALP